MGLGRHTAPPGPLPQWLQELEERQRRQLEQHEEATRELVEVMRKELLEKLAQMEKSRAAVRRPAPLKASPKEEEKERPPEAQPIGQRSKFGALISLPRAATAPSKAKSLTMSYDHMNHAMMNACGVGKLVTKSAASLSTDGTTHGLETFQSEVRFMPRNRYQAALYRTVSHHAFEVASGTLIILYTIAVGVMSDLDMRAAVDGRESPALRYYVDMAFTTIFFCEVVLRIMAEGLHFFTDKKQRAWNIFDLCVAFAGFLDLLTVFDVNLSFLRVLRALRAVRVLRVIRIFRFFKELRMMVASILCCMVSLTWAFTLLISVMYVFAVVLMQGASDFLHGHQKTAPLELRDQLAGDFGDICKTIYSLTQAVSGGRSWGEYATPFIEISPWYGVLFTLFVVFVIFGMLNILTGVFVESTSSVAHFDKELVIQEEMARNESVVGQIRHLFKEIDHDNSGTLTLKELKSNLQDDRVKAYFSTLQMDVSEAAGLFELLDRDESGEVSIDEFIMTCMRLKGTARSIDLATMLFESKRLYATIKGFMNRVDEGIGEVQAAVRTIQSAEEASTTLG